MYLTCSRYSVMHHLFSQRLSDEWEDSYKSTSDVFHGTIPIVFLSQRKLKMLRLLCIVSLCLQINGQNAGPQANLYNPNNNIPIVRYESTNNGEAGYNYAFETGDGTTAQEQGFLKDPDSPTAQGAFGFVSPEGQRFEISYTADENGFLPQGAHIPTPPPIPPEILKALEQNAADEAKGIVDDGQYRPEQSPREQFRARRSNL